MIEGKREPRRQEGGRREVASRRRGRRTGGAGWEARGRQR